MEPRYDNQNRRLCTANRHDGQPCRAPAIKGHRVCNRHGGQLPSVKAAAQRRLLEAADPAAASLVRIALDKGLDSRVRLAAINSVLDRAGVTPPKQFEISVEHAIAVIDREIARLEGELGATAESL